MKIVSYDNLARPELRFVDRSPGHARPGCISTPGKLQTAEGLHEKYGIFLFTETLPCSRVAPNSSWQSRCLPT